jgi:hypothetical protein
LFAFGDRVIGRDPVAIRLTRRQRVNDRLCVLRRVEHGGAEGSPIDRRLIELFCMMVPICSK